MCMKHIIERPMQNLITFLDGPTSGKVSRSGVIGKLLGATGHHLKDIGEFEPIRPLDGFKPVNLDLVDALTNDQAYFVALVVINMQGPEAFKGPDAEKLNKYKNASPPNISTARWLGLGCNSLRVRISPDPEMEIGNKLKLEIICRYTCTVYAYAWLEVIQHPSIVDGSRNFVKFMAANQQFFREVEWENEEGVSLKERLGDIFEGNSYWLHEENILLSIPSLNINKNRFIILNQRNLKQCTKTLNDNITQKLF